MRFDIGRVDAAFKTARKDEVDAAAEAARTRFIPGGTGQAQEYDRTRAEAQAYKAAGYPSPIDANLYPFTYAQVAAYNQTGRQAADTILAQSAVYEAAIATIRQLRLSAKVAIDAATTMAAARAAATGIPWPTP